MEERKIEEKKKSTYLRGDSNKTQGNTIANNIKDTISATLCKKTTRRVAVRRVVFVSSEEMWL